MVEQNSNDKSEVLMTDEEDELYGYGILNVHHNQFITFLGSSNKGHDTSIIPINNENPEKSRSRIKRKYLEVTEGLDNTSHLRVVAIRLDNVLDFKCEEARRELEHENQ